MATRKKTAKTDAKCTSAIPRVHKGAKKHTDKDVAFTATCTVTGTPAQLAALRKEEGIIVEVYDSKAKDKRYRIKGGTVSLSAFATGAFAAMLAQVTGNKALALSPKDAARIAARGEALHRNRETSAQNLPASW